MTNISHVTNEVLVAQFKICTIFHLQLISMQLFLRLMGHLNQQAMAIEKLKTKPFLLNPNRIQEQEFTDAQIKIINVVKENLGT